MRIIAGKYRHRQLFTLEGLQTRPMLDHTKEAVFSSIRESIPNATVLDLFGGSGALSIEALSRGAKQTLTLDNSLEAIKIIKKNKEMLQIGNEMQVIYSDYQRFLKSHTGLQFDIIFLDPPFRLKIIEELINQIIQQDLLKPQGVIIAQYPSTDVVEQDYPTLEVKLCRIYSHSEVLILRKEH